MGYQIVAIQNSSDWPGNPPHTIVIKRGDDGWEQAYKNWLAGKHPTNSEEWKKGVCAISELITP